MSILLHKKKFSFSSRNRLPLLLLILVDSLGFSRSIIISYVNKHDFISSFLIYLSFFCYYHIALDRTSSTIWIAIVKSTSLLCSLFQWEGLYFLTIKYYVSCRFLYGWPLSGWGSYLLLVKFVSWVDLNVFKILFFSVDLIYFFFPLDCSYGGLYKLIFKFWTRLYFPPIPNLVMVHYSVYISDFFCWGFFCLFICDIGQ